MARLGALYAAQTGDRSQCVDIDVDVDVDVDAGAINNATSTHGNTSSSTSTHSNNVTKNSTSTFCACVFETCGNGVWARHASHDNDDEETWKYVKACERYCHAGTCV